MPCACLGLEQDLPHGGEGVYMEVVSGLTMYKALDSGPASESGLMFMLVTKDRGAGSSRVG